MLPMLIPLGQFLCCCLCAHARMASSQGETDSGKLQPVQTDAATRLDVNGQLAVPVCGQLKVPTPRVVSSVC